MSTILKSSGWMLLALIRDFCALPAHIKIALVIGIFAGAYIKFRQSDDFPKLDRSYVLITGASQGLGEHLAYQYAKRGARLVLTARNEKRLEKVAFECQILGATETHFIVADLESKVDIEKLVTETKAKFQGKLDTLILNHVKTQQSMDWNGTQENFNYLRSIFEVNVFAYIELASRFVSFLEKRAGQIVVISSVTGKYPAPYFSAYSSTKFALQGFFGGFRQELQMRKSKVGITLCVLGRIDTPGQKNAHGSVFKRSDHLPAASAEDTAKQVMKAAYLRYRELYYPYILTRGYTTAAVVPFGQEIMEMFYQFHLAR